MSNVPNLQNSPMGNPPDPRGNLPPANVNVDFKFDAGALGAAVEGFGKELAGVASKLSEKFNAGEVEKILGQINSGTAGVLTAIKTVFEVKPNLPEFPKLPPWPPWPEWPPLPQTPLPPTPPPLDAVETLKQIILAITAAEGILNDNGLAIISGHVETELSVKLPGPDGPGAFTKINFQITPKPIH